MPVGDTVAVRTTSTRTKHKTRSRDTRYWIHRRLTPSHPDDAQRSERNRDETGHSCVFAAADAEAAAAALVMPAWTVSAASE